MSDFHKKAAEAASRLAAAGTLTLSSEDKMSQSLAQDRPTIDSAVKSYMSLISARSLAQTAAEDPDKCAMTSQDALACCRVLLKAINSYTFALDKQDEKSLERRVVSQLWNGLVASKQKPSRFLGRRALLWAYKDLELKFPEAIDEKQTRLFENEFGQLLQYKTLDSDANNDAALLWDADGGQEELARRRQRRADRAEKQKQEKSQQQKTPFIEELKDDDKT